MKLHTLHPVAWVIWLGAVLLALSLTRNPLYLVLVLLCIAIVGSLVGAGEGTTLRPWRFIFLLVLFATLFNGLTVHYGDTVLFFLPRWLPVVGGAITAEALAYGALNGLALVGFFAAFAVVTAALPARALLGLLPPAFYPVAVVIAIAVSFVPTTLRQFSQIREAQAVRGHVLRGWRSWLPLWTPLLVGGLERALQLAEALVARGFASSDQSDGAVGDQLLLVAGLGALLTGWLLRLAWGFEQVGIALMALGVGLVLFVLWRVGRRTPRTSYRATPWRAPDTLVVAASALVVAALLALLPGVARSSLFFYPYPRLLLPPFDSSMGIALLGLLAPAARAFLTADRRPQTADHRRQTADRRPQTVDRRPQTVDRRPQADIEP